MTISFEGTSKRNLTILELDLSSKALEPLENIADLMMDRWIPYQTSKQQVQDLPDLVCVPGSSLKPNPPGDESVTLPTYSGLIGTILTAYNSHQNIVLRPDDLWVTLLGQFSAYINGPGRAEELRSKIVNHAGQMELEVTAGGSACSAPYANMTRQFLDEIASNLVDPTLAQWFLPGFSTTTFVDEVVASASAMCAFQAYFTYTYSMICGIPQITLLGSVEDWEQLRAKVERFVEFDGQDDKLMSEQWVPLLRTVLDHFVQSAKEGSNNNRDFWDQMVQFYLQDNICAKETHLTGWLSVFTFFDGQGQVAVSQKENDQPLLWPRISFDSINHNVVSCPTRINDNGKEYNATLYVGQMAFEYSPDNITFSEYPPAVHSPQNENAILHSLIPRNDWAMAIIQPDGELRSDWDHIRPDIVQQRGLQNSQCMAINSEKERVSSSAATRTPHDPLSSVAFFSVLVVAYFLVTPLWKRPRKDTTSTQTVPHKTRKVCDDTMSSQADAKDTIYLNNAGQAWLDPKVQAVGKAVTSCPPWEMHAEDDQTRIRKLFATLIDANPSNIAIMPSTAFATTLVARNVQRIYKTTTATNSSNSNSKNNNTQIKKNKVLLLQDQFCSAVYPWQEICEESSTNGTGDSLSLKVVPYPKDNGKGWTEAVLEQLTEDVLVTCLPPLHWSDGAKLDLQTIGHVCKQKDIIFMVDATQAVGIMPCGIAANCGNPVVLACSVHKWLRGPPGASLVYMDPTVQSAWLPLDQHGRSRQVPDGMDWEASRNEMGPRGYPEKYVNDARKFDSGGKPNPVLLPMMRMGLEHVVERVNLQTCQDELKQLMDPLLDWALANGFVLPSGPHVYHLVGIRPTFLTTKQMLEVNKKLAAHNVYIAVRCGGFRIAPYLNTTKEEIAKFIEILAQLCQPYRR